MDRRSGWAALQQRRQFTNTLGQTEDAQRAGTPLAEVGTLFFALGGRLRLGWLRDHLRAPPVTDAWSTIAVGGLVMDLRQVQRYLTERYVRSRRRAQARRRCLPPAHPQRHPPLR